MHDDGYFGERVAATYDRADDDEFDPTVIAATVDFLVEYAGQDRRSTSRRRWWADYAPNRAETAST